ncbi:unnamed protein product [Rotaria sordida]|uniref:Large ribosomal subunit protein uL29 n=1 Tax=Rotaria sordida TaxID=392033 RepID=A0A814MQL7_9BILA|nr:unnamed protein product [Rotaria sordida]
MAHVTCCQIREKSSNELENILNNLHEELNTLKIQRQNFNKIENIRKSISHVHIVQNQTTKDNLREFYHDKKYKPKDLRPKQTRAMRRLLTPKEESISLTKTQKKKLAFPKRTYSVKD